MFNEESLELMTIDLLKEQGYSYESGESIGRDYSEVILEYNLTCKNDISSIVIEAVANDNKATVEYEKNITLNEGLNNITIKVTAEDGTIKEYKLNITREELVPLVENIEIEDDFIVCECGVSLSFFASFSLKYNISSFYQFSLIPGLLSGAIVTNASSYGKAISHDLLFIEVMTLEGKFKIIKKEEIIFSYHDSSLKEENFFIYKAYFKKRTSRHDIKPLKSYYETKKLTTQDYSFKSLGSTFQNINFFPIGKMIQKEWKNKINLYHCEFSSIHGNFLLVSSFLPYENILKLIESTSLLLYNKLGFGLQKEIEIIE